jgi:hypothetical protein
MYEHHRNAPALLLIGHNKITYTNFHINLPLFFFIHIFRNNNLYCFWNKTNINRHFSKRFTVTLSCSRVTNCIITDAFRDLFVNEVGFILLSPGKQLPCGAQARSGSLHQLSQRTLFDGCPKESNILKPP